jgi:hypothetical protein
MIWENSGLLLVLGDEQIYVPGLVIAVFLVSFFVFLFVLFRLPRRRGSGAMPCQWQRSREKSRPPFVLWQCRHCAVEAYSTGRRPPKECKRLLKSSV